MKKRIKKERHPRSLYDTHHLLWRRHDWEVESGASRALREFWYCRILIPRDSLHRIIHEEVFRIPVPNEYLCEDCLEQLKRLEAVNAIHDSDSIIKRLEILICCLDTGDSPTAEALKQQLEVARNYSPS